MKKSIAIILLGSALLLPNNIQAEAAYKSHSDVYKEKLSFYQVEGKVHTCSYKHKKFHKVAFQPGVKKSQPVKVEQPVEQPKPSTPVDQSKPTPELQTTTPAGNSNPAPATPVKDLAPAPQAQQGISAVEQAVLDLTNKERQKAGLAPLQIDTKLMSSARQKSADMAKNRYFSHTSPTYGSPFDQMKANGISYRSAAENIAMGQRTAAEVVQAWMDSPGHRQNILTAQFTHIGIGYDANGHYWTQQFITK